MKLYFYQVGSRANTKPHFGIMSLCLGLMLCFLMPRPAGADRVMTLSDALQSTLASDPGIQAARERQREAETLEDLALANWRPSISARAGLFTSVIDGSNFSGRADGTTTKEVGLGINQPLYRGGQSLSELNSARALITAEKWRAYAFQQDRLLETGLAYAAALRDRHIYNFKKEILSNIQKDAEMIADQVRLGMRPASDLNSVRAERARQIALSQQSLLSLKRQETRLRALSGIVMDVALQNPDLSSLLSSVAGMHDSTAIHQNPEILAARAREEAAKSDAEAARRRQYPQLSAYADYNHQTDPQPGIIDRTGVATFGVNASIDLYQGGAQRARITRAERAARRNRLESMDQEQFITGVLNENKSVYTTALAEMAARQEEVNVRRREIDSTLERIQLGAITPALLFDQRQDLLTAKIGFAQAEFQKNSRYFTNFARNRFQSG